MEQKHKSKRDSLVAILLVLFISIAYSVVRYNIFKGVPWSDFPLYVLNKSLSLSALVLFAYYHYSKIKTNIEDKKYFQEYAIIFIVLHIVLSFLVLTPAYFPKFYTDQIFNVNGSLSLFFGVLALGILLPLINRRTFKEIYNRFKNRTIVAQLFFSLTAAHVFVMGFNGWLVPSTWPGGLPPITLISFIVAMFPIIYKFIISLKTNRSI